MFVARRHICKMPQQPSYQDNKKAATSSQSFIPSFTYLHLFGHSYSSTSKAKYRTEKPCISCSTCPASSPARSDRGRYTDRARHRERAASVHSHGAPASCSTGGSDPLSSSVRTEIEIESPVGLPAWRSRYSNRQAQIRKMAFVRHGYGIGVCKRRGTCALVVQLVAEARASELSEIERSEIQKKKFQ
jgi:hypothetical protein